jgi:hypothetical protein
MYKWILGAIVLLAGLLYFSQTTERPRTFNRKLSYSPDTYAPYDTRYFYETLKKYTEVSKQKQAPTAENMQDGVFMVCSPYFHPSVEEAKLLKEYVMAGNSIFISTFEVGEVFQRHFFAYFRTHSKAYIGTDDSLKLFGSQVWEYPGEGGGPALVQMAVRPKILYKDGKNKPALIQYPFGKGQVYLLLRPTAVSNYFLLHKNNYTFLECLLPLFEGKHIVWSQYYENKKEPNTKKEVGKSYFWEMVQKHSALQFALAVLFLGTILFVINYSQRLRDPIEEFPSPENRRLQFIKTLARLPYTPNQAAHKWKQVVLEHLEQKYRIHDLETETSESLATKTGQPERFASRLLSYLNTEEFTPKKYKEFYHFVSPFLYNG